MDPNDKRSKANEKQIGLVNKTLKDADFEHFNTDLWMRTVDRIQIFNQFLMDYDLIGMSEDRVRELLGEKAGQEPRGYKGDLASLTYYVSSGGCDPFGVSE